MVRDDSILDICELYANADFVFTHPKKNQIFKFDVSLLACKLQTKHTKNHQLKFPSWFNFFCVIMLGTHCVQKS